MRHALLKSIAFLVMLPLCVQASEVIDRISAVVNGHPIFESDVEESERCTQFMEGRHSVVTRQSEQPELQRLIDQELLREQMAGFNVPAVRKEDIDKRMQEVRRDTPSAANDAAWKEALERAGITEDDLRLQMERQLEILQFLDVRLRPSVRVSERSVRSYFNDIFLPELKRKGQPEVPYEQVSARIREILVQQRMGELLTNWLQTLHDQSDVRVLPVPAESAGKP